MAYVLVFVAALCVALHSATGQTDSKNWNIPYRPQFHYSRAKKETFVGPPNALVKYNNKYNVYHEMITDVTGDNGQYLDPVWGYTESKNIYQWNASNKNITLGDYGGSTFVDSLKLFGGAVVAIYSNGTGIYIQTSKDGASFTPWSKGKQLIKGPFFSPVMFITTKNNKNGYSAVAIQGGKNAATTALQFMNYDPAGKLKIESTDFFTIKKEFIDPSGKVPLGTVHAFDFFSLGNKYVLIVTLEGNAALPNGGSGSVYWVGDVKTSNTGVVFEPLQHQAQFMDEGGDAYGFRTFSDGKKVKAIGAFGSIPYVKKDLPFNGGFTFPRVLSLTKDNAFHGLNQTVDSSIVTNLRCTECKSSWSGKSSYDFKSCKCPSSKVVEKFALIDFSCKFKLTNTKDFQAVVTLTSADKEDKVEIGYDLRDAAHHKLIIKRGVNGVKDAVYKKKPVLTTERKGKNATPVTLYGLLDASSLELFFDDGEIVMTAALYPKSPFVNIAFKGAESQSVHRLKSVLADNTDYHKNPGGNSAASFSTGLFALLLLGGILFN